MLAASAKTTGYAALTERAPPPASSNSTSEPVRAAEAPTKMRASPVNTSAPTGRAVEPS